MLRVLLALILALPALPQSLQTKNIIFVMTDGLRLQETFTGADPALLNKEHGNVSHPEALKQAYWRDTPAARREALLPFLWTTIARQGQIYGNRALGSDAYVTNGHNFSYPGYNETLTGFPDERIDSNDKKHNPNVTVFEWLHNRPAFRNRVAAFGAWDVFPYIFNAPRAGFLVNAAHDPVPSPLTPRMEMINTLKAETKYWDTESFDSLTFHSALEFLKQRQPRLLFLSLGETDEWAHAGQYALYLHAAHRVDAYLKKLWDTAQSIPQYRGQTTLIVTVDHGRGEAPVEWRSHGRKIPDSKYIWIAFLGPDTPPLGERSNVPPVTQSQLAATLAALLGEDYNTAQPKAAPPIAGVIKRP
jgi:hypothetical protein